MKCAPTSPVFFFLTLQTAHAFRASPRSYRPTLLGRRESATRLFGRESTYVDELLNTVATTDRGVKASPEKRKLVDGLVKRLERSYAGSDAAATPEWLYRETEVVYVGQRDSRRANAAGGKFRGRFGRLIFSTKALSTPAVQICKSPVAKIMSMRCTLI